MAPSRPPRRRPETPSVAPTSITECARRYHAAAAALATSFGLPLTAAFVQAYHSAISSVYIEAGRAGVRLPSGVQLPPLTQANGPLKTVLSDDGHHVEPVSPLKLNLSGDGQRPDEWNAEAPAEAGEIMCSGRPPTPEAPTTGDTALSVITTVAELPTRIPAGLQLPCAEALIVDLRPPQLSLLIGKVGLRALADKTLAPLHVALLAERAKRLAQGRKAPAGLEVTHGDTAEGGLV